MPTISIKTDKQRHEQWQKQCYKLLFENGGYENIEAVYREAFIIGLAQLCGDVQARVVTNGVKQGVTPGVKQGDAPHRREVSEDALDILHSSQTIEVPSVKTLIQNEPAAPYIGSLDFVRQSEPKPGELIVETVEAIPEEDFSVKTPVQPTVEDDAPHQVDTQVDNEGLARVLAYLQAKGLKIVDAAEPEPMFNSIVSSEAAFTKYVRTLRDEANYPEPEQEYDEEGKPIPSKGGKKNFVRPSVFPPQYVIDKNVAGGIRELPYELQEGHLPPEPHWYLVLRQDIPEHERKRHDYYASFGMRRWHSHYESNKKEGVDIFYWSPDPKNWADRNDNPVKPFPQLNEVFVGYPTREDMELDLSSTSSDTPEPARKQSFLVLKTDDPNVTPASSKTIQVRRRARARAVVRAPSVDELMENAIKHWEQVGSTLPTLMGE